MLIRVRLFGDGIRLLMCREAEKLEWLREAIGKGLVSLGKGEAVSDDGLLAEVKKKGRSLMKARQKRK